MTLLCEPMLFSVGLLFISAATFIHNDTEDYPLADYWKYDLERRRKFLYKKISNVISENETVFGTAPANWSLERFIDRYLGEAETHCKYTTPSNWVINDIIDNNNHELLKPNIFENLIRKYGINMETIHNRTDSPERWKFKDFIEKYEPMAVYEEVIEKGIAVGQNDTHDRIFFSLIKDLDSTDELLSLKVPPSTRTRRWWNNQWPVPQPDIKSSLENGDLESIMYSLKQYIYETRDKMIVMQKLRKEYKTQAVYKMGYLFAKTDYACKIFSSLAFKSFRACTQMRQKIFGNFHIYYHYMDIVYNIERLLARWFDVDIYKDLLMSNDIIARKVILKDQNLTTPELVVKMFDKMFID